LIKSRFDDFKSGFFVGGNNFEFGMGMEFLNP
jgi:hypothetical protein